MAQCIFCKGKTVKVLVLQRVIWRHRHLLHHILCEASDIISIPIATFENYNFQIVLPTWDTDIFKICH